MAKDLNSVVLIGRLVRDPEIKYTASGSPVTKFSIANNDSYMSNNEVKELVNFFDIVVWGNQAVNCEKYLRKGSQAAIEGMLRQNRWTDQNGQNRSKIEIIANRIQFLSSNNQQTNQNSHNDYQQAPQQAAPRQNQPPVQNQGPGFIQDPWGDNGQANNNNGNNEPYQNDDDIPF